mmetsp:Transcript_29073/g.61710  ORF Transcript_29073/g.61710 Transcript_29073/m.61710 type:complete len:255 (+) Transcript_29073:315-1079(+)
MLGFLCRMLCRTNLRSSYSSFQPRLSLHCTQPVKSKYIAMDANIVALPMTNPQETSANLQRSPSRIISMGSSAMKINTARPEMPFQIFDVVVNTVEMPTVSSNRRKPSASDRERKALDNVPRRLLSSSLQLAGPGSTCQPFSPSSLPLSEWVSSKLSVAACHAEWLPVLPIHGHCRGIRVFFQFVLLDILRGTAVVVRPIVVVLALPPPPRQRILQPERKGATVDLVTLCQNAYCVKVGPVVLITTPLATPASA